MGIQGIHPLQPNIFTKICNKTKNIFAKIKIFGMQSADK